MPRTRIENKLKTGDVEQLAMVWAAYEAIVHGKQVVGGDADMARKDWSKTNLKGLDVGLDAIETKLRNGVPKRRAFAEVSHEYENLGLNPKLHEYKQLWQIQEMVRETWDVLGRDGQLFVVNLVMFDFRTAAGGRARKSTSVLRSGADPYYSRPFEDKLPLYADFLLSALGEVKTSSKRSRRVILNGKGYLPPTRFTATFPLILEGAKDDPKILEGPSLSSKHRSSPVKYAFLPSFGFAEPGYCTWKDNDRSESAGTRLSLGAYSLDANYTLQIVSLWKRLEARNRELYARYGSVSRIHLLTLYEKFSGGRGHKLGIQWVFQMVDVARALADSVVAVHPSTKEKSHPLHRFFDFVNTKIDIREAKIRQIQEQGIGSNLNLFEYLWVFESTLWEMAMLGASCLSLEQMAQALGKTVSGWTPTIGLSELALSEQVQVNEGSSLERHYFPSGTSAADNLYEALWALKFRPVGVVADPERLSTFTPYFEFYQPEGALLDPEQIRKKSGHDTLQHTQIWINLSDSLHAFIIRSRAGDDVGADLGALVAVHLGGQLQQATGAIVLVVDFTKFAGDMPNNRIYPILASFREELLRRLDSVKLELVFFRSNLKYNTGSLDRYQAGEVLIPVDLKSEVSKRLPDALRNASGDPFSGDTFSGSDGWQLKGAYVPLMKRTYLLADAVAFGRWTPYAALWGEGKLVSLRTQSTTGENDLRETVLLSQWFVSFVEQPLALIFNNLIADLDKRNHARYLPLNERTLIRTTWKRICADADLLARSSAYKNLDWRQSGLLLRPMRNVAGYLKPELSKIVQGMAQSLPSKKQSRWDKSQALRDMRSYRARLQSALSKIPDLDVLKAKTNESTFEKPSDTDTVDMNGAHCFECDRVHGPLPSLIRRWHVCDTCRTVYCYSCGYKLPFYEFEDLDEVLDAMDRDYTNPRVRACGRCDGPTALS